MTQQRHALTDAQWQRMAVHLPPCWVVPGGMTACSLMRFCGSLKQARLGVTCLPIWVHGPRCTSALPAGVSGGISRRCLWHCKSPITSS